MTSVLTRPIKLGVNIDHVATLRQARHTPYPDPIAAALLAEEAGADLITLHLREDRRHIQDADVRRLRALLTTRMNLEMAVTPEMIDFALEVHPHDVCLVPERRAELTTEGGLDVVAHFATIADACRRLGAAGVRVSLFIDADPQQLDAAHAAGAPVVEIHTGRYADAEGSDSEREFERIRVALSHGTALGLHLNAGHGLHYDNVARIAALPEIEELNIGHAIVAQAIFVGWQRAVSEMKQRMLTARS